MSLIDTPKVWVIVPLSRPRQLGFVHWQYERLRYQNKGLVIVESKHGRGACEDMGLVPSLLIQSDGSAGQCKNLALDMLEDVGASGYWVTMDDDDFYGADYLDAHLELHRKTGCPITMGKYEYLISQKGLVKFKHSSMTTLGASIGGVLPAQNRFLTRDVGEEAGMLSDRSKVATASLPVAASRLGNPENHTWRASLMRIYLMHEELRQCKDGSVYDYLEGRSLPKEPPKEIHQNTVKQAADQELSLGLPATVKYQI